MELITMKGLKMITRKEYMENSTELFQRYYEEVAEEAGVCMPESLIKKVEISKDKHLNDVPLFYGIPQQAILKTSCRGFLKSVGTPGVQLVQFVPLKHRQGRLLKF